LCHPVQYKGHWHPNNEIYNSCKDINVVGGVKIRRLGWAGSI